LSFSEIIQRRSGNTLKAKIANPLTSHKRAYFSSSLRRRMHSQITRIKTALITRRIIWNVLIAYLGAYLQTDQ